MPPRGFQCKRCGHCCLELDDASQHAASAADVARWVDAGREDILEWVCPLPGPDGEVAAWDVWINPKTGGDVERCPWLRKARGREVYGCAIYELRPDVCRGYPQDFGHAKVTGCRGFDPGPPPLVSVPGAKRPARRGSRGRKLTAAELDKLF